MTVPITTNDYIEVDPTNANNNIIKKSTLTEQKIVTNKYITIDDNSISLTAYADTHYLYTLSKGNCETQWQDWFCIPNYHNINKYGLYPKTKNMDIGACFKYCNSQSRNVTKVIGQNNDDMYISKDTKCSLFEDEDELIYNPLAIIAIIGTHFNNENSTPNDNFNTFSETIGLRGSYLNELWRVNTDSDLVIGSIPRDEAAYGIIDTNSAFKTNQDKLLMKIIYKYGISNKPIVIPTIGEINENINEAYYRLIARNKFGERYYTQNDEFKKNYLKKIKNYVFDINSLENAYGTDKKGKNNMINIIAYAYNIMRLICFQQNTAPSATDSLAVSSKVIINDNIKKIMNYKGIESLGKQDDEDKVFIIQMFKYACFNCFNVNFDIFKKYINDKDVKYLNLTDPKYKFPCDSQILKKLTSISYYNGFDKLEKLDLSDDIIVVKRIYDYYDNIEEYNHNVMYEYAENAPNMILILMIFAILLAFVITFGILYAIASYWNLIPMITNRVNFCHLFYECLFYGTTTVFCNYYYYLCKNSNSYTIGSIITNISNILLIIFAFGMLYYALMELLNVDYISLLNKIEFNNLPTEWFSDEGDTVAFNNMIIYFFLTYLLSIFFYSIYITRYSLSADQYDIIGNRDADSKISTKYLNYILLKTHNEGLLSKFVNIYPELIDDGVAAPAPVTAP